MSCKGFILKGEGKKALILLHGLTGSPSELRWIGGKFNQEGYNVYCPILPGHCTTIKHLEKNYVEGLVRSSTSTFKNDRKGLQ